MMLSVWGVIISDGNFEICWCGWCFVMWCMFGRGDFSRRENRVGGRGRDVGCCCWFCVFCMGCLGMLLMILVCVLILCLLIMFWRCDCERRRVDGRRRVAFVKLWVCVRRRFVFLLVLFLRIDCDWWWMWCVCFWVCLWINLWCCFCICIFCIRSSLARNLRRRRTFRRFYRFVCFIEKNVILMFWCLCVSFFLDLKILNLMLCLGNVFWKIFVRWLIRISVRRRATLFVAFFCFCFYLCFWIFFVCVCVWGMFMFLWIFVLIWIDSICVVIWDARISFAITWRFVRVCLVFWCKY